MKTVRGVAALGAAVILLAGCGADAEPKFEADPSGAPSSVSPSQNLTLSTCSRRGKQEVLLFV